MNRVHPQNDSKTDVFSEVQPLIVSLLDGSAHYLYTTFMHQVNFLIILPYSLNSYDVCVMAYGQTGSGKTHTMLGSLTKAALGSSGRDSCRGVLTSAVRELFR